MHESYLDPGALTRQPTDFARSCCSRPDRLRPRQRRIGSKREARVVCESWKSCCYDLDRCSNVKSPWACKPGKRRRDCNIRPLIHCRLFLRLRSRIGDAFHCLDGLFVSLKILGILNFPAFCSHF